MEIRIRDFLIREWRRGDEESLVRHANNPNVSRHLREIFPYPYTADEATRWIMHASSKIPTTDFAIVVGGEAAGGIGFFQLGDVARRSVDIGYWLGEAHWGKGIMTDVLRAMSDHIFANFDVCRIQTIVFESNLTSIRVLEKAGYSYEGRQRRAVTKNGITMDALMYALVTEH